MRKATTGQDRQPFTLHTVDILQMPMGLPEAPLARAVNPPAEVVVVLLRADRRRLVLVAVTAVAPTTPLPPLLPLPPPPLLLPLLQARMLLVATQQVEMKRKTWKAWLLRL